MKRGIVTAVLVFICFILQTSVFELIKLAGITPNILLILISSVAVMRGQKPGMIVGFFCGLLMDIFYGPVLGFHMLLFTYIGYLNGYCYRIFYDDDIKMPVLLIALSDIAYGMIIYIFQFLFRGRISLFFYLRRIIIPEVIYTALITLIVYRLLLALNHKLEKAEQRSVGSFV